MQICMIKYLLQRASGKWIDQWNAIVVKTLFEDFAYHFYRNTSINMLQFSFIRNLQVEKWLPCTFKIIITNKNIISITRKIKLRCENIIFKLYIRASKYLQLSKILWLYIVTNIKLFHERFLWKVYIYSEEKNILESLNTKPCIISYRFYPGE